MWPDGLGEGGFRCKIYRVSILKVPNINWYYDYNPLLNTTAVTWLCVGRASVRADPVEGRECL